MNTARYLSYIPRFQVDEATYHIPTKLSFALPSPAAIGGVHVGTNRMFNITLN